MDKNILIIYGGNSTEHDVSIITALQIFKKYKIEKSKVWLVYIDRQNDWYIGESLSSFTFYRKPDFSRLKKVRLLAGLSDLYFEKKNGKLKNLFPVDFVVNCCHGDVGESGDVTSLLEMCKIPTSTGDSASLKLAMDKYFTKLISLAQDIPTVDFFVFTRNEWITHRGKIVEQAQQFGFPVVVKPSRQGSSVGVSLVSSMQEFEHGVNLAFEFDDRIIIERAITSKREFNCCLIKKDGRVLASSIEEPMANGVIISFKDKYMGGKNSKTLKNGCEISRLTGSLMEGAERKIPASIPAKLKNEIIRHSKAIYSTLDMCGIVRVDFIYDNDAERLYLGEVNSIPGSLGFYFWGELNILDIIYQSGKKYWTEKFTRAKSTPQARIFDC